MSALVRDRLFVTFRRRYVERSLRRWLPHAEGRVLCIGSGGRSYRHLLPGAIEFTAVDLRRFSDTDAQGSVYKLPFRDATFDSIYATELLEHLADPRGAVLEIHRVLRPNGKVLLTVPFIYRVHGDPEDYFRYTSDGLRALTSDLFESHIEPAGNRFTVIWDLITTAPRRWVPTKALRLINMPVFWFLRQSGDQHFPSGYELRGTKIGGPRSAQDWSR